MNIIFEPLLNYLGMKEILLLRCSDKNFYQYSNKKTIIKLININFNLSYDNYTFKDMLDEYDQLKGTLTYHKKCDKLNILSLCYSIKYSNLNVFRWIIQLPEFFFSDLITPIIYGLKINKIDVVEKVLKIFEHRILQSKIFDHIDSTVVDKYAKYIKILIAVYNGNFKLAIKLLKNVDFRYLIIVGCLEIAICKFDINQVLNLVDHLQSLWNNVLNFDDILTVSISPNDVKYNMDILKYLYDNKIINQYLILSIASCNEKIDIFNYFNEFPINNKFTVILNIFLRNAIIYNNYDLVNLCISTHLNCTGIQSDCIDIQSDFIDSFENTNNIKMIKYIISLNPNICNYLDYVLFDGRTVHAYIHSFKLLIESGSLNTQINTKNKLTISRIKRAKQLIMQNYY